MKPAGAAGVLAALLAAIASAQVTADQWNEDLRMLATELPKRHKNAFAVMPREDFEKRVATLAGSLKDLSALDAEGGLVTLVAALGDSHSRVEMRSLIAGPRLPLGLHWFQDGLRVLSVPKRHEKAAGGLVKTIGSCNVPELQYRLSRIQHFDNESMLRSNLPHLATFPNILAFLDVVEDPAKVPVTVTGDDGEDLSVTIDAAPPGRDQVRLEPASRPVTGPRQKWHHHELLADEGILYVQYNKCESNAANDLAKLTDQLVAICAEGSVKAIVFDVQYNGGGDSRLGDRMFAKLAETAPMKDRKNVFCVVGRYTFSSAILNALALEATYGATLVGEPTGGSPNHFGEVTHFELPNSRLKVFYSQKRFERAPPGTTTIQPDHVAVPTFADYLAGRDVVMETIRKLVK